MRLKVWFTDGDPKTTPPLITEDPELIQAFMDTYDQDQADEGSPAILISRMEYTL